MWKHVSIWNHVKYLETHWIFPFLTDINQMKIMYMSEDVDVESTFVKNVGFGVRNPACSRSISARILMSGLMYASCVTLPSKQKVWVWFFFFFKEGKLFFFLMAVPDSEYHFVTVIDNSMVSLWKCDTHEMCFLSVSGLRMYETVRLLLWLK